MVWDDDFVKISDRLRIHILSNKWGKAGLGTEWGNRWGFGGNRGNCTRSVVVIVRGLGWLGV